MIVPALLLALAIPGAPTCKTADPRVEALVTSYVRKTKANEYCQARLYHTIDDLDGDAQDDFVVIFTLEGVGGGGNNSSQYLAIFLSTKAWKPVVLKVGERGERYVDDISVEEGRTLVLTTSEFEDGDPMCCPSGDGELRYRIEKGQLKQVPNPTDDDSMPTADSKKARPRRAAALVAAAR
jgi:hypothetical protein